MAIKSRRSEDHLHTSVIMSRINSFDIFKYYCPSFERLGKKFCSELRKDNNPTASIINWNNKLLYKDFGYSEHTFDCFSYVQAKHQCSFADALRIIDMDFGLGLGSNLEEINYSMGIKAKKQTLFEWQTPQKITIIKKKRRAWDKRDAEYWKQFGISKKTLEYFNVEPISHYWINENRFTCKDITYAYKYRTKYKIYAPHSEVKWMSNTTARQIQGWVQLDESEKEFGNDVVIITSSLKDVMCLHDLRYPAIALQSEMQFPEDKLIETLKNRFKMIALLYDNDFNKENNPGQSMATKIMGCFMSYKIQNLVIHENYHSKDLSDFISIYGVGDASLWMESQLRLAKKFYEKKEIFPFQ